MWPVLQSSIKLIINWAFVTIFIKYNRICSLAKISKKYRKTTNRTTQERHF